MPLKTGNDSIPIEESWFYRITPGYASSQWVEVTDISSKGIVTTRGLDNTIADLQLPRWHFDDIVVEYIEGGMFLVTEDSLFDIVTEEDEDTLGQ